MRRHGLRPPALVLAALAAGASALAAGASGLAAQTVQGTAVDAASGEPVTGAFVVLLDELGVERARGLTTASGTYRVGAPGPGTYRLSLERIGFEDLVTEPMTLEAGETVSRSLEATGRAIELDRIRVTGGEPRCGTPTGEALELSRVWDEARKALEGTAWTDRQSYYRFDVLLVRKLLDEEGQPISAPEFEPIRIYGRHPFRAIRPDDLAYGGWVQREGARGLKFFAPDAEVLLSDSFLARHCFALVAPDSAGSDLVGIRFEPLPGRRLTDIAGVLWLDRETAELRELRFSYVNLRLPVPTDRIGGRVEFDHLPDGGWIVRAWEIRTPLAEVQRLREGGRQRVRLSGLQLEGQEVLAVWRTGDLRASPGTTLPAEVPPVNPPPDEVVERYPPSEGAEDAVP